jgi:Carboxypeptidase regulatory-like domain/Peptidase family M1 domain
MSYQKSILLSCALVVLWASLVVVFAAGGQITGTVTDPKGAVVAGAAITVTDPVTNKTFNATTDQQGRYKVEGLPAGSYVLTILAKGFSVVTRESVKVEENGTATVDAKLEVAPVEAEIRVASSAANANADPVYQQLRRKANDPNAFGGSVASVNNLVLKRDAAVFTLRSGELYFLAPTEERTTAAVFIGEGEMSLTPPTETEKKSLAIFIDKPTLTEQFTQLVLRFSDKTFDEVKALSKASMKTGGAQAERARTIYRDHQSLLRKQLRTNLDIRTLADIYAPQRAGFFIAFIQGRQYEKLIYQLDPQGIPEVAPEEVMLFSYGESNGGIWTAFHLADSYADGTALNSKNHWLFDIKRHEIDGSIRGTQIAASDRVTFRALVKDTRVLPFNLYGGLRVTSVQDEQGRNLDFIQEAKDEDADFAVVLSQPLLAGRTYKITVQYQGVDALKDSGGGNYILLPRWTWYPNNGGTVFGDRALFDMVFHYPKGNTFVGTGAPVGEDTLDGEMKVSKWSGGTTELAVAGFNYGRFRKKEIKDPETGYNIEFYANEEVPDELKEIQHQIAELERKGYKVLATLGSVSTTKMGDAALADAQNSTRIYNTFFGKLPYSRIAMTQQPAAFFGQAWPTLIYMPYIAFIDSTHRHQLFGAAGADTFWRYVGPHELAHQWWAHIIGFTSYHDQWMSEGFSEFSTSLYVQYVRKDEGKFIDFWEEQRKLITQASDSTKGRKPYTVGPVTQGFRLSTGKTGNVAQYMIYPKGAYILHMLRMLMFDPTQGGDARFQAMMADFVRTYYNKDVTTEDFKEVAAKHMPSEMDLAGNGRMDWFFDQWVYGTEIPSYRFDYKIGSSSGQTVLNGRITQSGVGDDFRMKIPVYVDFGKGWERLGAAAITGNKPLELNNIPLPQKPKRIAICALNDVLALSITNNKQ